METLNVLGCLDPPQNFPLAGKLTEWKPLFGSRHLFTWAFPLAGKLTEWKPLLARTMLLNEHTFPLAGKLTEWKR